MPSNRSVSATSSQDVVRLNVALPSDVAERIRTLAKTRLLSASRMLAELVKDGLDAQKHRQEEFYALARRFRAAKDAKEVARLGDELGRMVFGG